jgi:hypothetical protein
VGYGDQLMAAGQAELLYAADPAAGPVSIVSCTGVHRWSPLWDHNPAISRELRPERTLRCGDGCLPYLDYINKPHGRLLFSSTYRAADARGHIYLTAMEKHDAIAHTAALPPFVLLEPFPQDRYNVNRQWPLRKWQALITLLHGRRIPIYGFEHRFAAEIDYLPRITSENFRMACALMQRAVVTVMLEGGLAFGAAAVGAPAIVLWGGCVSARTLAFPEHVNIVDDQPETPCGTQFTPCAHCTRAWQNLSAEYVADVVESVYRSALKQQAHG